MGAEKIKIIVRLLNGKNGKPIKHEFPNIWLGDAKFPTSPQAEKGDVNLEIGAIQPREIRVMPNYYVDCRFGRDTLDGNLLKYSLDEIASKGVVAENRCGQVHTTPIPGVLVLYVRPMTLKEKLEL
jgi:hypothetical protein